MDKKMARIVTVLSLLVVMCFIWIASPQKAFAESLSYPDASKPCVWAPYSTDGLCKNSSGRTTYEWGAKHNDGSWANIGSPRGYAYRNCTDYVAWKLQSLGVADGWTRGLGNGGQWYDQAGNKPGLTRGTVPKVGAAAIVPWDTPGYGGYGHVAYVEEVNRDSNGNVTTIKVSEYNRGLDGAGGYRTGTPADMKFTEFVYFGDKMATPPSGSSTPLPNPDRDGDSFLNAQDQCPDLFGKYNGCPLKADFSLDGKSDVASFYRYDNNAVNLWMWNGQSNLYTSGPYSPWSAGGGWDGSRLMPAGNADFNGGGEQDTAAFYAFDGGGMDLDVWYGNRAGTVSPMSAWHVSSGWEQARLIPAGAGDFNNDGYADVAAFYHYDNDNVTLYIWYGQANMYMNGPYPVWNGNGWDAARIIPAGVGDADGDGHPDISTFYRHDNGMMDQNVWYSNGLGGYTLGRPWHADTGWDGARFVTAGVADLNGDHIAETIAFYRQDNMQVDMRVWYGTTSRIGAADPDGPWSGFNGWDGNRILPAGTGDYNGDGRADIATFYRFDDQTVDLNIWYGDGTGGLTLFRGWHADTGWEGSRLIPAKG